MENHGQIPTRLESPSTSQNVSSILGTSSKANKGRENPETKRTRRAEPDYRQNSIRNKRRSLTKGHR